MARHERPARAAGTDWHKADIKAALEKRGWSLRSLANHLKLNHTTLAQALHSRYPAAERRIADAIGLHPMVLWPSRYNKDGTPNGRRGNPNWIAGRTTRRNRSTHADAGNGKNARAR